MLVLVVNAGSSSLKYQLLNMDDESVLAKGNCDRIGIDGHISHKTNDGRKVDDDLEIVTIPSNTYAVFTCKGKMPDAFTETYHRIVTEFFPQSTQYEYAENVEFEVYPSADTSNPNYTCEVWIAVKEKNNK